MSKFTFNNVATVRHSRSIQNLSHGMTTSFNMGELVPLDAPLEIYPGDTFKERSNFVVRTSSPLVRPIMANVFLDVFYFWCPNKDVMDDFGNVFGKSGVNDWVADTRSTVPHFGQQAGMSAGNHSVIKGGIADHFGLPTGFYFGASNNVVVSVLPFRHYANIWNNWFRSEAVDNPMNLQRISALGAYERLSFNATTLYAWDSVNSPNYYCSGLAPVCKIGDYFTKSLPAPQKGGAVPLMPGSSSSFAPLVANGNTLTALGGSMQVGSFNSQGATGSIPLGVGSDGVSTSSHVGFIDETNPTGAGIDSVVTSTNLGVNVSAGNITVNDVRRSFAIQKILENSARNGTRYYEFIKGTFGVNVPQTDLHIPEFLGGKRIPLRFEQVVNTAGGTNNDELGAVASFSLSAGDAGYTKSFTEHGYIITLGCIRMLHKYSQGIAKFWSRINTFDFYQPDLANLGEQPVYLSELYAKGATSTNPVFGYQEAWNDLRFLPSMVTGDLRSTIQNMNVWSLHDNYTASPTLSAGFIHENKDIFDSVLTVKSTTQNQFIVDCWHKIRAVRVLPAYSVPKLVG